MGNLSSDVRSVTLTEFYPDSASSGKAGVIPIVWCVENSEIYFPDLDGWAGTFAKAVNGSLENFAGKRVMELGSGSLVHGLGLITCSRPPLEYIGVDITDPAISLGNELIARFKLEEKMKMRKSDLLADIPDDVLQNIDHVFGCIPQMQDHPALEQHFKFNNRNLADLAPLRGVPEDAYGLGLLADALNQIKARLFKARVTLILAGRPGEERLHKLFNDRNYRHDIIYKTIVQQDPGTPLDGHVAEEQKTGLKFKYYADPEGRHDIDATTAHSEIGKNYPVYHDLFVMTAVPR